MSIPKKRNEISGKPNKQRKQGIIPENPAAERINQKLGTRTPAWLAKETDVPHQTISDTLRRGPASTAVAVKVAAALDMSLDELFLGKPAAGAVGFASNQSQISSNEESMDLLAVPIFDISASAGVGIEGKAFMPSSYASFPCTFLRTLGDPAKMEIVRIDGDSMEPELRHRDMAMIDRSETQPRDGLVVARLGEDHVIKRLRLRGGGFAELVSNNPAYSPINVNLSAEDVAIVGRVVWVGKTY